MSFTQSLLTKELLGALLFFQVGHATTATAVDFTKKGFIRSLEESASSGADELIQNLKIDAVENVTLAYKSGALLPASSHALRPLIWNKSQDFLITFNSHGDETIEALNWREDTSSWELLELDIKKKIWKVNQQKCLDCHGPKAKPIWAEYPKWEGFVGSSNDVLRGFEFDFMQNFLKQSHLRTSGLRSLVFGQNDQTFPFRSLKTHLDTPKSSQIHRRPNMRLGQWMSRRNAKSVFKQLKENLDSKAFKKLFSLIGVCTDARDYKSIGLLFKEAGLSRFDLNLSEVKGSQKKKADWEHLYFDGDAEVFEYLLWFYYKSEQRLEAQNIQMGLLDKYSIVHQKNFEQKELLSAMDALAQWIPLPFSKSVLNLKRRRHPVEDCGLD